MGGQLGSTALPGVRTTGIENILGVDQQPLLQQPGIDPFLEPNQSIGDPQQVQQMLTDPLTGLPQPLPGQTSPGLLQPGGELQPGESTGTGGFDSGFQQQEQPGLGQANTGFVGSSGFGNTVLPANANQQARTVLPIHPAVTQQVEEHLDPAILSFINSANQDQPMAGTLPQAQAWGMQAGAKAVDPRFVAAEDGLPTQIAQSAFLPEHLDGMDLTDPNHPFAYLLKNKEGEMAGMASGVDDVMQLDSLDYNDPDEPMFLDAAEVVRREMEGEGERLDEAMLIADEVDAIFEAENPGVAPGVRRTVRTVAPARVPDLGMPEDTPVFGVNAGRPSRPVDPLLSAHGQLDGTSPMVIPREADDVVYTGRCEAGQHPKVALMFMTQGSIPTEALWVAYLKAAARVTLPEGTSRGCPIPTTTAKVTGSQHYPVHLHPELEAAQCWNPDAVATARGNGWPEQLGDEHTVRGLPKEHGLNLPLNGGRRLQEYLAEPEGEEIARQGRCLLEDWTAQTAWTPPNRHHPVYAGQELFTMYVQTPEEAPRIPPGSLFFGLEVGDRQDAPWSSHNYSRAVRALLRDALKDPLNGKFVMLTEDVVPLYPPHMLYAQLLAEPDSRVAMKPDNDDESVFSFMHAWDDSMASSSMHHSDMMESEPWVALSRDAATIVAEDEHLDPIFAMTCKMAHPCEEGKPPRLCTSATHYMPSLLHSYGMAPPTALSSPVLTAMEPTTGQGVKRYYRADEVTPGLVDELRESGGKCTGRGASMASLARMVHYADPVPRGRGTNYVGKVHGFSLYGSNHPKGQGRSARRRLSQVRSWGSGDSAAAGEGVTPAAQGPRRRLTQSAALAAAAAAAAANSAIQRSSVKEVEVPQNARSQQPDLLPPSWASFQPLGMGCVLFAKGFPPNSVPNVVDMMRGCNMLALDPECMPTYIV